MHCVKWQTGWNWMRCSSASLQSTPALNAGTSSRGSSGASPLPIAGPASARSGSDNFWCPFAGSLFAWKLSPFVPLPGREHSMSREKGKQARFAENYPAGLGFLWRQASLTGPLSAARGAHSTSKPRVAQGAPSGCQTCE